MHIHARSKVERSAAVKKYRVTVHMFFEQSIRAAASNSLSERLSGSEASDKTCPQDGAQKLVGQQSGIQQVTIRLVADRQWANLKVAIWQWTIRQVASRHLPRWQLPMGQSGDSVGGTSAIGESASGKAAIDNSASGRSAIGKSASAARGQGGT